MVVLIVAGIILLSAGQKRKNKPLMLSAGLAILLTGGVFLLAKSVTTDREQLIAETRALVMATAPLDGPKLDQLIDPAAIVTGPSGAVWVDAGQILPRLKRVLRQYPVQVQKIRMVDAAADENGWAKSTVTIRTETNASGDGVNTSWLLHWRRDEAAPGGWRVVDIRWMMFNGMATPQGVMP